MNRATIRVVALTAVIVGALAGCVMEPPIDKVTIRNDSDLSIAISEGEEFVEPDYVVEPGEVGTLTFSGLDEGCEASPMTVWTVEGVLVATLGPPVCDDDLWVITQADVDAGVAGQPGTPAPTPTGQ